MKLTPGLAELIGAHLGDGCISVTKRYKEYVLAGDRTEEREYHEYHLIPLFNKEIAIPFLGREVIGKDYPSVGVYGIYEFDRKLADYCIDELKLPVGNKLHAHIPKYITNCKNKEILINFVRGIFDTDGCVCFHKNYTRTYNREEHCVPRIEITLISRNMFNELYDILIFLGLRPILKKPYREKPNWSIAYKLILQYKSDIKYWLENIGFNNPKHKTKVKIWKKFGSCPPYTTLEERRKILKQDLLFN